MTIGDLYPDVRLYSAVVTIIMTRGGAGGKVRWEEGVWEGRRRWRWQGMRKGAQDGE